jgi:predicted nucleotidyltransferase
VLLLVGRFPMKRLKDLGLDDKLQAALQTARNQIAAEFAIDRIVLFGSVARGQADEESDVDLLVVLKDSPSHQERDLITSIILEINLEYDTNLSELIVDRQTWDTGLLSVLPIHQVIEEEGIRL